MAPPPKHALPQKEQALFKTLLGLYEQRQNKKAIKTADQILKKVPEHGETLSMKGLILTGMNRKEEGLELIRKGIRLDLTSHICWHVYGIVQKADKNYEEALKSYMQALRFDKENMNILRDAASLQMQLRLYDGLQETRQTILRIRPTIRQSWIGLAVAYHLNGKLNEAKTVIEHYNRVVKEVPDYDFEHSEVQLYYVRILQDLGLLDEALAFLDTNAKSRVILDKIGIMVYRAQLFSLSKRKEDAEAAWKALIEHNPESYEYYREYLAVQEINLDTLNDETRARTLEILESFAQQLPRSTTPRRLALTIASPGEHFTRLVRRYILQGLTRGIPSLFVDLKALYSIPEKHQAIEDLVLSIHGQLEKGEELDDEQGNKIPEDPSTYIWTIYYLAQHFSISPKTIPRALELLEKGLDHSPALPELHMVKARALKRAGDPIEAAKCMEDARKLDLQDRFLNTKSAKYMYRAGWVEEANNLLGMFTKKDTTPGADLEEMQSLFYFLEEGGAYDRSGTLNLALKRYHGLAKTFDDIWDDQVDFHTYTLRKYTLNMYLLTVKFLDKIRNHPAYRNATVSAARIYVRLHQDPALATASTHSNLTSDEKKAKKKAKKAELKQEKKVPPLNQSKDDPDVPPPPKDEDPDGLKLLHSTEPLENAAKLLRPLEQFEHHGDIDAWCVSYDVHIRRKKYLQALRALNLAREIDSDHPSLHERIAHFKHTMKSVSDLPSHVQSTINSTLPTLIPTEVSAEAYNTEYLQKHGNSATAQLAVARVVSFLRGAEGQAEAEELVFQILRDEFDSSVQTCLDALPLFKSAARREEFSAACAARFPLSTVFKPPKEQAALRTKALNPQTANGSAQEVIN